MDLGRVNNSRQPKFTRLSHDAHRFEHVVDNDS
jgi:hypothetical protein